MDGVINQIQTLSTNDVGDLKKLRDFLRQEHVLIMQHLNEIDQTISQLDPEQHTLGIAFLLAAQFNSPMIADSARTFAYVGNFLLAADEFQAKRSALTMNRVCKGYAQMAIDAGQRAMLQSLRPLQAAVEKVRPTPETLTPAHTDFLRVCLKSKAYHLGARMLAQPIFDIALEMKCGPGPGGCGQLNSECFLCYFYYGALIRIGMKQFSQAMQLLLVVLTCPASCLSAIQADAYKKFVLVSLRSKGKLSALPVYCPTIVQRYAKNVTYATELADAFVEGNVETLRRVAQEKEEAIQADNNVGLVKQVIESLQCHKIKRLTNTYLTLSLAEIAKELGLEESCTTQVEELLFNMISSGEISARIDQATGNVAFEDEEEEMDVHMVSKMQEQLRQVLGMAQRIAVFEQEVVASEAYIKKTATINAEGVGCGAGQSSGSAMVSCDFMDM